MIRLDAPRAAFVTRSTWIAVQVLPVSVIGPEIISGRLLGLLLVLVGLLGLVL